MNGRMLKAGKVNDEISDGCMHLIKAGLNSLLYCWLPPMSKFSASKLVWQFCRQEGNGSYMPH